MPIEITYTDAGAGVVLTGTGTVTGQELVESNNTIFARDLAAQPYRYILFDANGMIGVAVSTEALREIADQGIRASPHMPRLVFAIYANSDLAYGLARMWQIFVHQSGWKTHVFHSRAAAVAWLREETAKESGLPVSLV